MTDDKNETPNIDTMKAELDKAKNDYLYLLAEFDNYRKNAIKERSELVKYGSEKLVRELLGILDNFDLALAAPQDDAKSGALHNGVQMIAGELKSLLQKFGVEEVKSEGELFDPTKHEALSSEPRTDVEPGRIVRVFKKAYGMHDKLLRPAQVVVASSANGGRAENHS